MRQCLVLSSDFHCKENGGTKYMETGRHRGMIANAHIRIDSNSYEKVKNL